MGVRKKEILRGKRVGVGREEGEMDCGMVLERDKELQREERLKKIRESRYNKWYSWIKGGGKEYQVI